jgi:hypothetical protein
MQDFFDALPKVWLEPLTEQLGAVGIVMQSRHVRASATSKEEEEIERMKKVGWLGFLGAKICLLTVLGSKVSRSLWACLSYEMSSTRLPQACYGGIQS